MRFSPAITPQGTPRGHACQEATAGAPRHVAELTDSPEARLRLERFTRIWLTGAQRLALRRRLLQEQRRCSADPETTS